MGKKLRGVFTGILGASMAFSSLGVVSAAPTAKDIKGHWAEERLQEWIDKGYIQGYQNGTVQPNRQITRAEFVAMINRVFEYTETSSVKYKDLPAGNWAYNDISKAVKAGYIKGYTDNTIRPNAKISRQESAAMIARILGLTAESNASLTFKDANKIAAWSKGSVAAVAAKDIVNGYPDGTFGPERQLTRAEAVAMIRHALTNRPAEAILYDKAGTYGNATIRQTLTGSVTISAPGVTLQNMDISGDLILAEGIGQGDVTLNNVKVAGKTFVYGGGSDTVHFMDSTFGNVIVDKKTGTVRIVAGGSTTIQNTTVESPATLLEQNLTGSGFMDVELSKELAANALVTLTGAFNNVNVLSPSVQLHLTAGSIQTLTVDPGASNVTIRLDSGTNVVKVVLNAIAKVLGAGTIQTAVIADSAKGTTFETNPKATEGSGSTTSPPTGTTPSPGSGSGGGSGGGGGGGGTTPTDPPVDSTSPTIATYGLEKAYAVTADVYLTSSEPGTAFYVVLDEGTTAPTKEQITTGMKDKDTSFPLAGSSVIKTTAREIITLNKLTGETKYEMYFVVKDSSGNVSDVKTVRFTTVKETKPQITITRTDNITTVSADVYFTSSDPGKAYYKVFTDKQEEITTDEIMSSEAKGSIESDIMNVGKDTEEKISLMNLPKAGHKYYIYLVVRDEERDISEVKMIEVNTGATSP